MKVYIVSQGNYSDCQVMAVYANLAEAVAYGEILKTEWDIEEFELQGDELEAENKLLRERIEWKDDYIKELEGG